jgi:hypothetical protein
MNLMVMGSFGNMRSEPCVNAATDGEYACGQRSEPEVFSQLPISRITGHVVFGPIPLVVGPVEKVNWKSESSRDPVAAASAVS